MTNPAPSSAPLEVRKAECSKCGGIRNCDVRGSHRDIYSDEQNDAWTHWRILKCRGCEHTFVEVVSANSEDCEPYVEADGSQGLRNVETFRYWPALARRHRPEWMSEYGISDTNTFEVDALEKAMVELYQALDADLRMLAGIGIRTAYDIASELLGVNPDLPFSKKMDALVAGNKITSLDRSRLETMVDAGSAAAHRGWCPSPQDLDAMMSVLEHFVYEAFVAPARRAKLDASAAKVKGSVPPRKPRTRKAKASVSATR